MSTPYHHSVSSARKWGGDPLDYQHIHDWFDETKHWLPNWKHRLFRHHCMGIHEALQRFGPTLIRKSDGVQVPLRPILEQHIIEDCGIIPTPQDWLSALTTTPLPAFCNRSVDRTVSA